MSNSPIAKKDRKFISARFHAFLATHPPLQVNRHLRSIFMDYISSQLNTGFPLDFDDYLWELSDLFELMDDAAVFYPLKPDPMV